MNKRIIIPITILLLTVVVIATTHLNPHVSKTIMRIEAIVALILFGGAVVLNRKPLSITGVVLMMIGVVTLIVEIRLSGIF
jgi:hypothetical protein